MANNNYTVFQRLDKVLGNDGLMSRQAPTRVNSYDVTRAAGNDILYATNNKEDYDTKKLELRQDAYLANQWYKSSIDLSANNATTIAPVQLMYRDADLMDTFPEINKAMKITTDEATTLDSQGRMLRIDSSSPRIKSVLEDLFFKRLRINTEGPRIIFNTMKYGNHFRLMNVSSKEGYKDWREMPVYEVERFEDGVNAYSTRDDKKTGKTFFRWQSRNSGINEFQRWQVAHFRLMTDSMFLPYGQSYLNSIRRHFRMLYMMEDAMLIYRMDRSVERRVFKIYVGNIDEKDVPQYVNQVINQTKRGSIIDPQTGQIDIRKNWASVIDDYYIPVRDPAAPSPIENLPGAQNLTAIDDIKFMQSKVFTGLHVPRSFLNFDEAQGEGKNLAIQDVRFARSVMGIQMAFISELTYIAMTHLSLLGFKDDLTNFTLSMNNPSQQVEQLSIEINQKRIGLVRDAVSDPGNGLPILSLQRALKMFMNMSEDEIKENFNEMRLEKALSKELENTNQIIKRTHIFDEVDRLYGEPGAEYQDTQGDEGEGGPSGPGGGGFSGGFGGGGGFGDGLESLGGPGGEGEINGEEGVTPIENAEPSGIGPGGEGPEQQPGNEPPAPKQESKELLAGQRLLEEKKAIRTATESKDARINETFEKMVGMLDDKLNRIKN